MSASAAFLGEWDADLVSLLDRLSTVQNALLTLLAQKRQHIVARDHAALAGLAPEEARLGKELEACFERRKQLLQEAEGEGQPARNLLAANKMLPAGARRVRADQLEEARRRSALIRHECLSQWVVMQRSVLHLSHLLEIIATRGRGEPTYGRGGLASSSGALIDRAV